MVTFILVIINIGLSVFSAWTAHDAWEGSTTFRDITTINSNAEATWYLIPLVVSGLSALVKPVKLLAASCSLIITLSGAFVVWDSYNDTTGKTYNCFADAGIDLEKQEKCANEVLPTQK